MTRIFILLLCFFTVPLFALGLDVIGQNHFVSYTNVSAASSSDKLVLFRSFFGTDVNLQDSFVLNEDAESDDGPLINRAPLFYPSPFRFEEGSTLGYSLKEEAAVVIRLFDMQGNKLLKRFIASGDVNGGAEGYNYVPFMPTDFAGISLPAGIYFYLLESDGDILAKGKFAVMP